MTPRVQQPRRYAAARAASTLVTAGALAAALALAGGAAGQEATEAPESLKVYFGTGSAAIGTNQRATLDQAARLFRDGNPIVMIVAGGADTVGPPDLNLALSIRRADAVVDGLTARGIPVGRLQVLGRGNSELAVETGEEVAEAENRIVEITWR